MFTYFCTIDRVIDGDTVVVTIDLGLHIKVGKTVRLLGINAPEMDTQEGKDAKAHLTKLFADSQMPIVIQTKLDRDDKYGRLLGTFFIGTVIGKNLNQAMVDDGFAKVM